ncbi:PepSY-associated TM helix domain-containing protein [Methylomonas sp. MO1]|uniref:PepSY-associated TM helix domain-containing protein n=1 Tax=unclassified Methylomonas TaxID=2608980 RepID=UPI00047BBEFE|nr:MULTISPECIES: PepSY-associated TM helix domain-containing protein [unclassified Methylomonas]MDT4291489.1 PepSY-associated TM helix domain-containing protein [Methylomonas sp. MO1]
MPETHYPLIVRPRFILNARKWWRLCHVYLALCLGLIFALIGLTGSLSIYREELDSLLNPQLRVDTPQSPALSPDKIVAAVRAAQPDRHGAWTLEMPRTPDGMITAWFEKPKESVGAFYAPLMVSVNPYTGQVVDSRLWGQTLTTWLLDLHTQLQLDGFGRNALAVVGGLLMLSVFSGLYLWWPGWRALPRAFSVSQNTGLMRLLFDLHRLLGVASSGFLILLAFTGFHLAYPTLLENLTAASGMGHGDAGPNVRSSAIPNDRPTSLSEAILVARGPFPSSEVRRITTPVGELGTYRINLRQLNEINQHHPFTTVWVDRWSGQIRDVQNPNKFSAGQTFTTWLWPLHTGEAFGESGRLLWFFVGLTPTCLFLSGLIHWLYRHGFVADREVDLARVTGAATTACITALRRVAQAIFRVVIPAANSFLQKMYGRIRRIKRLK